MRTVLMKISLNNNMVLNLPEIEVDSAIFNTIMEKFNLPDTKEVNAVVKYFVEDIVGMYDDLEDYELFDDLIKYIEENIEDYENYIVYDPAWDDEWDDEEEE